MEKISRQEKALVEKLGDRWTRLTTLYKIINKQGKEELFNPNPEQRYLNNHLWYLNLILKARQLGFTTYICLLFLDICLFNSNVRAGIIAHNREDAESFFKDKIKFAYDKLPAGLKAIRPSRSDSTRELSFSNNSSIRVGTSLRSGTLQLLHVSEFGKICAQYPAKAKEIVTGAFNTIQAGQYIFVESTAEGKGGYFHDYCVEAQNMAAEGRKLSQLQFKFFFFPWWKNDGYRIKPELVRIPNKLQEYFADLEGKHGIKLDASQKAWYVEKKRTQGDDITREYPSYAEEAFLASVEGQYYASEMRKLRERGRITTFEHTEGVPVNLGWDLGIDDETTIWAHQRIAGEDRLIGYIHGSGEGLAYYVRILRNDTPWTFGNLFLPHDGKHKTLQTGKSTQQLLQGLGFNNVYIVERTLDLLASIETTRRFLLKCWIEAAECEDGIKSLDNYRKKPDRTNGGFLAAPLHDWASHGADGFRTLACGIEAHGIASDQLNGWTPPRG